MQMTVIIDIVLAAILVLCTIFGWRRGAFKSVIGIVVVLVALVGAGIISNQAAPVVAEKITPILSQQIEMRFEEYAQQYLPSGGEASQEDAQNMFSAMGLYQKTAENLAKDAVEQARQTGQAMMEAAVNSMIQSIVSALLFILAFVVLLIVLTILSKVLGLLTAVPGLHLMDAAGGAIFGLVQGCLILFAIVWAAQFWGNGISEQLVQQTILFRFFATLNPIAMVSGL